jgi:hypothetical protein
MSIRAFSIAGLMAAVAGCLCATPGWWTTRSVLSGGSADDYAAANIGQLKYIATKAAEELNATLPAGEGSPITNLIASWSPTLTNPNRDDYVVLNQGQLKSVASLFYDRLAQYGYTGAPLTGQNRYPWTGIGADDFAAANLGQIKHVFSFLSSDTCSTPLRSIGIWITCPMFGKPRMGSAPAATMRQETATATPRPHWQNIRPAPTLFSEIPTHSAWRYTLRRHLA